MCQAVLIGARPHWRDLHVLVRARHLHLLACDPAQRGPQHSIFMFPRHVPSPAEARGIRLCVSAARVLLQPGMGVFQASANNIFFKQVPYSYIFTRFCVCNCRYTQFWIDRFHRWNHSTCSRSFFISHSLGNTKIKGRTHKLRLLNSQVAEQLNSPLIGHRSAIRCMGQANSLRSVRLVTRHGQIMKISQLRMRAAAAAASAAAAAAAPAATPDVAMMEAS